MKNLIYFNNIKDELILSNNLIKNIEKLSKINKDKIYDLYNKELIKIKQRINIDNDYLLFGIINHQKLLTIILLHICKKYKEDTKNIPHFIISDFESTYIINICRQLYKAQIIDYSIININYYHTNINNIIDDIKILKKENTILCILSNFNNNSLYDLKKISSWCKYYNILTLNNIENQLYNEYNFSLSQDIIFLNFNKYEIRSKTINNYYLGIKKKLLVNNKSAIFTNNEDINKLLIQNNNILSYHLLNLFDINKYIFSNSIKDYHLLIINKLQESYKFIHFDDLIKSNNIKYYYNTPTIILLNNPKNNILINYIAISIFIPNIKFTNNILIEYFKNNNIILNNDNYKFYINKNYKNFNDIKKGLIYIKIPNNLKTLEISKFINVCDSFINNIFSLNKIKSRKKKKSVNFSNPEYIVLTKPYKNTSKKKIKSILKK